MLWAPEFPSEPKTGVTFSLFPAPTLRLQTAIAVRSLRDFLIQIELWSPTGRRSDSIWRWWRSGGLEMTTPGRRLDALEGTLGARERAFFVLRRWCADEPWDTGGSWR